MTQKTNKLSDSKEIFLLRRNKKFPHIAFVYPNTYSVASSNLGFHAVIDILHSCGYYANRFFINNDKTFFSTDTDKTIHSFSHIFVSIAYEPDLLSFLQVLAAQNIPVLSSNRKKKSYPLFIIGGAAVTINPYLYIMIGDYIFSGEFDAVNLPYHFLSQDMPDCFLSRESFESENEARKRSLSHNENRKNGDKNSDGSIRKNGDETLNNAIKKHVYGYYNYDIKKKTTENNCSSISKYGKKLNDSCIQKYTVDSYKNPVKSIYISPQSAFSNYFLIETSRGCPFSCDFCNYTAIASPYRMVPQDVIMQEIQKVLSMTNHIGLVSAVLPPIALLKKLIENFHTISLHLSSLRVDSISSDFTDLIPLLKIQSITIAPETAVDNQRRMIGKNFTNSEMLDMIIKCGEMKIRRFKFYFILGMFNDELSSIHTLINAIYETYKQKFGCIPLISLSFNPLIPKPFAIKANAFFMEKLDYETVCASLKKKLQPIASCGFLSYKEALMQYALSNKSHQLLSVLCELDAKKISFDEFKKKLFA